METTSSDDNFLWTSGSSDSDSTIFDPIIMDLQQEKFDGKTESENGFSKKTKKRKRDSSLNSENMCETYNESSKKTKKRKHDTSLNSTDYLEPDSSELKYEKEESLNPTHFNSIVKKEKLTSSDNEINTSVKKSKKKKKHKDKHERIDVDSVDRDLLEETYHSSTIADESHNVISKRKKKKKRKSSIKSENDSIHSDDSAKERKLKESLMKSLNENKRKAKTVKEDHTNNSSTLTSDNNKKSQSNDSINGCNQDSKHDVTDYVNPLKKVSKISERLRFEDDDDSDSTEKFQNIRDLELSEEIKSYQNDNKHLLPKPFIGMIESDDEEEWILFCPSQININDFKDRDLIIGEKNKLKIGGQSYNITLEIVDNLSQVRYKNNQPVVSHMSAIQVHSFCKRIPKPHMPEDEVMLNNQTNFIPLPETKCRHPLFGPNYKRAIKVPKSIEERLHPIDVSLLSKVKKKKHKNEKTKAEADSELETNLNSSELQVVVKKKKKRKHSETESTEKGFKKIKLESNSAGFWENEKSIEQNLFNF